MNQILFTKVQYEFLSSGRIIERILLDCTSGELSRQRFSGGENVVSSIGIILLAKEMEKLKPYLNTADFEAYRDINPDFSDPNINGYCDEHQVEFTGITNPSTPPIRIQWQFLHDDQQMLPHEKLFEKLNNLLQEYEKKPGKKRNVISLL